MTASGWTTSLALSLALQGGALAQDLRPDLDAILARTHLREIARGQLHGGVASALCFARDGKLLACGSHDGEVLVYSLADLQAPRLLTRILVSTGRVSGIAFAKAGDRLVVLAGELQVWDWARGEQCAHASACDGRAELCGAPLALDSSGTRIAFSPVQGEVAVLDLGSASVVQRAVLDPSDQVGNLVFSPDDRRVWLSTGEFATRCWDLAAGSVVTVFPGTTGSAVAFSRDGHLVLGEWNRAFWIDDHRYPARFSVSGVAISRDGSVVAVQTYASSTVEVYDGAGSLQYSVAAEPPSADGKPVIDRQRCFALAASGDLLAVGGIDGVIRLFRGAQELVAIDRDTPRSPATSLAFSKDGDHLAASDGRTTLLMDLISGSTAVLDQGGPLAAGADGSEVRQLRSMDLYRLDCTSGKATHEQAVPDPEDPPPGSRSPFVIPSGSGNEMVVVQSSGDLTLQLDRLVVSTGTATSMQSLLIPRDAAWTSDGTRVFLAGELMQMCGHAPRRGELVEWSDGGLQELQIGRSPLPNTVAVAWDDRSLYWADDHALHQVPLGQGQVSRDVDIGAWWFRCIDLLLGVSHDGYRLRLWDLRDLHPLRDVTPGAFQTAKDRRPLAAPIECAVLSPDRRRVAVATAHDIVVYEIARR